MKLIKWLIGSALVIGLLLFAFVLAGPWIAMRGIQNAVTQRDVSGLLLHVDFPSLRQNMRASIEDAIARDLAQRTQNNSPLLGIASHTLAKQAADYAVTAIVNPGGILLLLEGNALLQSARGKPLIDAQGQPRSAVVLDKPQMHYESSQRFVATLQTEDGKPVQLIFSRQGLRWRLTDIQLPDGFELANMPGMRQ